MKQAASLFALLILALCSLPLHSHHQNPAAKIPSETNLLKLLNITPSPESVDFIQNKTHFFVQKNLTEQPHPKTRNFSQLIQEDYERGLMQILTSYEDIPKRLEAVSKDTLALNRLVRSIEKAILTGHKVYVYSGATSGLAKLAESGLWRPFWKTIRASKKIWSKLEASIAANPEEALIGEMPGGDRGLLGSMEGLDDLLLMGWLQLEDHGIQKEDVVIGFSEGGDTPSVIGTLQAAVDQWKSEGSYNPQEAQKHLYFIYNAPDEHLLDIDRSKSIIEEEGITKFRLSTGPQSVSGSTRLQAATINTFFFGHILQNAIHRTLQNFLSRNEMARIGFQDRYSLPEKLTGLTTILKDVKALLPSLTRLSLLEAETFKSGHQVTYFANLGQHAVFFDCMERSLDFSLPLFDTIESINRKAWIQVWTPTSGPEESWQAFLGRDYRKLDPEFYSTPIAEVLFDPSMKKMALTQINRFGEENSLLYDFSLASFNITNRGPRSGDLGICILMDQEDTDLSEDNSSSRTFLSLFSGNTKNSAILIVHGQQNQNIQERIDKLSASGKITKGDRIVFFVDSTNDPLFVNQQVALKILLNINSTASMAYIGRVLGNTMTHLRPANFKFIGRATALIQSLVNDTLNHPQWIKSYGIRKAISYGEANAVLFQSMQYFRESKADAHSGSVAALSIIHILESLRHNTGCSQEEAFEIMKNLGLPVYLAEIKKQ